MQNLRQQDFHVYCPMIRKQRRQNRRVYEVLRPLFTNYLFVRMNWGRDYWRPICSTYGVRSLVRSGDNPGLIENSFIECLRAREVDGVIVRRSSEFHVNQQVRLSGGAMDGVVATIIALEEKDRLKVLISLLGGTVTAHVHAAQIAIA